MESQLQCIRDERDQYMNRLIDTEHELKRELNCRQQLEEQLNITQNQINENNQIINSLQRTVEDLNLANQDMIQKKFKFREKYGRPSSTTSKCKN